MKIEIELKPGTSIVDTAKMSEFVARFLNRVIQDEIEKALPNIKAAVVASATGLVVKCEKNGCGQSTITISLGEQ